MIYCIFTKNSSPHSIVGAIVCYNINMKNNMPNTLIPCDGRAITENDYPELFEVLRGNLPSTIEKPTLVRKILKKIGFKIKYKRVRNPELDNTTMKIPDLRHKFIYGGDDIDGYPKAIYE